MKIAMIGHKRIPSREGGVEIVVAELSKRLTALGNIVTVYNRKNHHIAGKEYDSDTKKATTFCGARLIYIPTPKSSKLNAIVYSFFATIRAIFSTADVIHYHAEGPASMVPLAKVFGKKTVVTIHGLDWQRAKWGGFATKFLLYGEKCAAKHADKIIVLSKNMQDYFLNTYNRQTVYLPNGIEAPRKESDEIIKSKYNLSKDDYILFLGRIVPEKGLTYLIDAFKNVSTDKKLVIAGGSSHTEEFFLSIKNMAKSDNRIIFTDFVQGDTLNSLYSNAYIYCLPSDIEGMPISLLEAMSYSNCCLTSNIEECTEVCGENAVYFEKSNTDDLAKKLQMLLDNQQMVQFYKENSAKYVLSKYNWDDIANKTLKVYEDAING